MAEGSGKRERPDNRSGPFTQAHLRTKCVNTSSAYLNACPLPVTSSGDMTRVLGGGERRPLFRNSNPAIVSITPKLRRLHAKGFTGCFLFWIERSSSLLKVEYLRSIDEIQVLQSDFH